MLEQKRWPRELVKNMVKIFALSRPLLNAKQLRSLLISFTRGKMTNTISMHMSLTTSSQLKFNQEKEMKPSFTMAITISSCSQYLQALYQRQQSKILSLERITCTLQGLHDTRTLWVYVQRRRDGQGTGSLITMSIYKMKSRYGMKSKASISM